MEGGLLMKTYFLAGRAISVSRRSAVAMARGTAHVAAWVNHGVAWCTGLLNPFSWGRGTDRHPPQTAGLQRHAGYPRKRSLALRGAGIVKRAVEARGLEKATEETPPAAANPPAGGKPASPRKENRRARPGKLPPGVTPAEVSAAVFAGTRDKIVFSKALEKLAREEEAGRVRAVRDLTGIRHELSVKALSACLARDASAMVRKDCVSALTVQEMKEGLPAVVSALSDASPSVRLAAVRGAYRLAGNGAAASLVRMFSDKHEDVRRRAVVCVGWLGEERLAAEIIPLLKDRNASVRRAALDALANIKSFRAATEVIELLVDPDESVGEKAFVVLRAITGKQMTGTFPDDEAGRQLLLARWRAWREEEPWHWES